MKISAIILSFLVLACSPQTNNSQSKERILDVCEMAKISDLKNVILFFGIPDDELSDQLLEQLSSDSFQTDMVKVGMQLIVANEMCVWMEALILEHDIKAFPTVLRLDAKGEIMEQLLGIATDATLRDKLLQDADHN